MVKILIVIFIFLFSLNSCYTIVKTGNNTTKEPTLYGKWKHKKAIYNQDGMIHSGSIYIMTINTDSTFFIAEHSLGHRQKLIKKHKGNIFTTKDTIVFVNNLEPNFDRIYIYEYIHNSLIIKLFNNDESKKHKAYIGQWKKYDRFQKRIDITDSDIY